MTKQQNIPRSRTKTFQMLLLVGVIVLFPLISFLVNMKGAQKGREFYGELKQDLGKFPDFSTKNFANEAVNSTSLKGETRIVSFATSASQTAVFETMHALSRTEQLQEGIDNMHFLLFDLTDDAQVLNTSAQTLTPNERSHWLLLRGDDGVRSKIKLPTDFSFALVDTSGTIRHFYDIRNADERRLLVEHIAVMPIRKKVDVEKKDQKQM